MRQRATFFHFGRFTSTDAVFFALAYRQSPYPYLVIDVGTGARLRPAAAGLLIELGSVGRDGRLKIQLSALPTPAGEVAISACDMPWVLCRSRTSLL
jgi:hypothetical protein